MPARRGAAVRVAVLAFGALLCGGVLLGGCTPSVSGTAVRPVVPVDEPCRALTAAEFADAYQVDRVSTRNAPLQQRLGAPLYECRYVRDGVIVGALQTGTVQAVNAGQLYGGILQTMYDGGTDVTAESVSGVGDVAGYLPRFGPDKQGMLSVKALGPRSAASGTVVIQPKNGLSAKAALTTMTRTAMSKFVG